MKRPYFNLEQRRWISAHTIHGEGLMRHLAFKKLFRDTRRRDG